MNGYIPKFYLWKQAKHTEVSVYFIHWSICTKIKFVGWIWKTIFKNAESDGFKPAETKECHKLTSEGHEPSSLYFKLRSIAYLYCIYYL